MISGPKHHNADISNDHSTYQKFLIVSTAILSHLLYEQTACIVKFQNIMWQIGVSWPFTSALWRCKYLHSEHERVK
jgi:hypothetical protein